MILVIIIVVYISNLIYLKLPFFSLSFQEKELSKGIVVFLLSFFPKINIELYTYNLQTIIVWSSGIIFGSKKSLIAITIYLVLGLAGLPVFAGGGGIEYIKEPTFGYILSLPFVAYIGGYLYEKNKKFQAVLFPILIVHLLGILYLFLFMQSYLGIAWYLSFSMIGYDLILGYLLIPILPLISFILNEMFIQETPIREVISESKPTWKK